MSTIVQGQGCYKRYAPDFPMFAQLMNTGMATAIATITLPPEEAAELQIDPKAVDACRGSA